MTNAAGTNITPGTIVGGKYRLERPVSRGGMGSVWAAQHMHLGATVALKFMDPSYAASPAFQARFQREAQVAARIDSPHVVKVQDYGIDTAGPYIVMELLRGDDLETRLRLRTRLPLPEVAHLLQQLGKALRRAHEAGLIHRDLKPRNIFLARVDDDEILKVLDFGIAKDTMGRSVAESTSTGELMGSPHYMSPEQLRADKDLDPRSDLWSVGVILFRCLTGRLPFQGEVLGTVMAAVLVDPVPVATRIAPDLPPGIDAFFARALARDREQRFQTIRELCDGFAQVTGGAPLGVTTAGVHMSPFGVPGAAPAVPASGPITGSGPAHGSSRDSFLAGVLPSAAPPLATPIPAGTPAGTLTSAGVTGGAGARARRMRAVWIAGALTLALVIGGAAFTAHRLTQDDTADAPEAAAAPSPSPEPTQSPAAPPPPAPEPATPAPAVTPAAADPASAADSAAVPATAAPQPASEPPQEKKPATAPKPTATVKSNPTPPKPPPKPPATPTATPKKPSWGF